jgi:hypothetical protein
VAIPWVQLIKYAPTILSLSREVMQRTAATTRPLDRDARIAELERNLQQQAEAFHAMATQMEGLTRAVASLRRALISAVALGAGALLLALIALAFALAR